MVIAAVIASYVYDTNRRGAVTLSNDLLDAIDQRIAIQMGAYLAPAEQFLESARAIAGERGVFDGGLAAEPFVLATLGRHRQIAGFSYGDPDGNFLYISRNAQGGLDTKLVDRRNGGRRVTWTRRDKDGAVVGTAEDPSDTFDPRTRGWYHGAMNEGHAFWTTPYIFFTVKRPGITYALPQYAANRRLVAVLGIDIELSALSSFLKSLEIGLHGKATGDRRQGPGDRLSVRQLDRQSQGRRDAAAARRARRSAADPHLQPAQGRGRRPQAARLRQPAHHRLVGRAEGADRTQLVGADRAPKSDFLGFVASSGKLALALSGVVFLLMAALAVLMMWRSLQAERRDRAARERHQALEARAQTLAELAARSNLMDRDTPDGVREATERAAEICRAKRVSVWYLAANGRTLVCEDNFDPVGQCPYRRRRALPRRVPEAVRGARGAGRDRRARGPERSAHRGAGGPLPPAARHRGRTHLADPFGQAPARHAEGRGPVLRRAERRHWPNSASRSRACSRFVTCRLAGRCPRPRPVLPADTARSPSSGSSAPWATAAWRCNAGCCTSRCRPTILPPASSSRPPSPWSACPTGCRSPAAAKTMTRARMDAVIDEVQRCVAQNSVGYAALLDDQVVLVAAGDGGQSAAVAARLVAVAALDVRDRLVDLTGGWGEGSEFRIAIDVGPVMASAFGDGTDRNLWGGAIGVAKVLAASGSRRAITVSEAAYHLLSADFLLRQRGSYFLPETGPMRTFVLAGAL